MFSPFDPTSRSAAADFLLGRENYERWRTMPYDAARMGLDRMRLLLEKLGSPERDLPVIHVAGTKGKGSTSAMIAAALQAAGYRTGLFTSPHLLRIEERIQIDGRPCIEQFDELVDLVRPAVERLDREAAQDWPRPTFFEIITAMAFVHFARQKVDVAVMEVGLGGRLDATNVCRPVVSIITSISFDHTQQLGNTLAAIATEKAGIVKPGVPVVSGVVEPEPRDVIRQICRDRGTPLVEREADFDFSYEPPRNLEREAACGKLEFRRVRPASLRAQAHQNDAAPNVVGRRSQARWSHPTTYDLSLPGRHQAANAAVALAAIDVMRRTRHAPRGEHHHAERGEYNAANYVERDEHHWNIPDAAVALALSGMWWPARVEVIARRPAVVLDAAHNVASVEALAETLRESFAVARRLLIFGTTQDKDVAGMLQRLLGEFDEVFFNRYSGSARAVAPEELQRLAEATTGRRWPVFNDSSAGLAAARAAAGADDLICITGSFFLAAEMTFGLHFPQDGL